MLRDIKLPEGRVLIISDLHLRDIDFTTVAGYRSAVEEVVHDITNFCQLNKVDVVISLGDMFDKGYRQVGMSHSHRNLIQELHDAVNGNLFTVLGNHYFLERDSNPLMYLMQPNAKYKPLHSIYATKPIVEVPNTVTVGCMQFSFFHFNKEDKEYGKLVNDGVLYHHGLYHDDTVIPNSIRRDNHLSANVSSEYTQRILSNIDMATVGHLHVPIGPITVRLPNKTIPMDIPGSLCLVQDGDDKHESVKLPMYDINEEGFTKSYVEFSLHTELLTFKGRSMKTEKEDFLVGSNMPVEAQIQFTNKLLSNVETNYTSLTDYMISKGCCSHNIRMVEEAASKSLDYKRCIAYTYKNEEAL